MKILPVGTEFFHTGGRTVRHDEANSRFRNFSNAPNQYSATCENLGSFQLLARESDKLCRLCSDVYWTVHHCDN